MFKKIAAPKYVHHTTRPHARSECAPFDDREGSTLLIVMVLLGMLSLVGFLFYTFAASERSGATYWADSQKSDRTDLDVDALFDWSLEQLIVGPNDSVTHSALAGRRHSLLPNLLGRDIHPYNGGGIHLGSNNGLPIVDQDFDGIADPVNATTPLGQQPLEFNDSAAANGGTSIRNLTNWPDPGVDYTYPDINNLFLAYKGFSVDANGNTVQVIIPSFHRPQLLRTGGGSPSASWWNDPLFSGRILRPHPDHKNPDGNRRYPLTPTGTLTSVFPFMPGSGGQQGVWSLNTPYVAGMTTVTYEWDVDNDGDSIKEGVWLDLNYPVQMDSTGRKFVPMFSYTVYDTDALFNLNVHGNHAYLSQLNRLGDFYQDDTLPTPLPINAAGNQRFLSGSNQGLTPSEVNPQYALNSDPNIGPDFSGTAADLLAALQQYAFEFGNAPTTRLTLSNMDWYRLLTGTANFQSATAFNDLYAGRYGEATTVMLHALQQGVANGGASATRPDQMPFPGVTGTDDNWNKYEGQFAWDFKSNMPGVTQLSPTVLRYSPGTLIFFPSAFNYYASYPYGQPLDFNGDGTIVGNGSLGKSRMTTTYNRMKYPKYRNYDNPGGTSTIQYAGPSDRTNLNSVAAGWRPDSVSGQQMVDILGNPYFTGPNQGPVPSTQVDEPAETIVEPTKVSASDNIFGLDENAALHLEATDRSNLSLSSRVRTLAPFNFSSSNRADSIAQRFATSSWDRKQFGLGGYVNPSTGLPMQRPWELTGGTVFPPVFPVGAYNVQDPFRPPVRKLLELTVGNQAPNNHFQFRLSLNHLTTTDPLGNIIQRPLTPHDPNLTATPVGFGSGTQEDLARRDRQQMARDIYVMLYTLGGGLDVPSQSGFTGPIGAAGYTGDNSGRNLYNDRQLREMAQFAVNVVDALDPDHVMTKFEYDKNLGNGWNLDDNPYDNDGFTPYGSSTPNYNADYPEDSDERGVVYGVEAQELTFSEAMVIRSDKVTMNQQATEYDDAVGHRYFTYVELRNISPNIIDMHGQYRIRVVPGYRATAGLTTTPIERRVTLLRGSVNPDSVITIGNAGQTDNAAPVAPNHSRFQIPIGYTSGTPMFDQPYAQIVPPGVGIQLDYDLLTDTQRSSGLYRITKSDDTDITTGATEIPGGFLNETTVTGDPSSTATSVMANQFFATFYLERRQYPDRPEPSPGNSAEQNDNPWVRVDTFLLDEFKAFVLAGGETGTQINTNLQAIFSRERDEPLDWKQSNANDTNPAVTGMDGMSYPGMRRNSMGGDNSSSAATFPHWQLTYDRPFASPIELLHIPVYGPNSVTRWTSQSANSPMRQTDALQTIWDGISAQMPPANNPGFLNAIPFAATAAGKILQVEHIRNLDGTLSPKQPAYDNRWYRLFEFFEVPTRMHRQLGNPLSQIRQPGKLNLNTLRHTDVLAGLLDDTDVMTFSISIVSPTVQALTANDSQDLDGSMPSGKRDWWVQFLKSRDGRLVSSGGGMTKKEDNVTGLFLPGLADSTPFRGLATAGFVQSASRQSPDDVLESTIFRKLPIDMNLPATDKRHLWEVGTNADHSGSGMQIDSELRHRLLSKIFNNTTTRSHVFLVFVSVQPFEADDSAGAQNVRIGGVLRDINGNPQFNYRGFFVIDRSQPEEAYVFDPSTGIGNFSNWQALVKYRLRLN